MVPNYKRPPYREYIIDVLERPLDDQDLDMINYVEGLETLANYYTRDGIDVDLLIGYIKYLKDLNVMYEKELNVLLEIRKLNLLSTAQPYFNIDNCFTSDNSILIMTIPARRIFVNKDNLEKAEELIRSLR